MEDSHSIFREQENYELMIRLLDRSAQKCREKSHGSVRSPVMEMVEDTVLERCRSHFIQQLEASRSGFGLCTAEPSVASMGCKLPMSDMLAAVLLLRQRDEMLASKRAASAFEHIEDLCELTARNMERLFELDQMSSREYTRLGRTYYREYMLSDSLPETRSRSVDIEKSGWHDTHVSQHMTKSEESPRASLHFELGGQSYGTASNEYEFEASVLLMNEKQAKWARVRVLKDSGCEVNIITGRVLEQSDVYKELLSRPGVFRGFGTATHSTFFEITLLWKHERTGDERQDQFSVFEDAPYDMVLGRQYLLETHILQPILRPQKDRSSALILHNWREERRERAVQAEQRKEHDFQAALERDAHLAKLREERRLKQASARSHSMPALSPKLNDHDLAASFKTEAMSTESHAQSSQDGGQNIPST